MSCRLWEDHSLYLACLYPWPHLRNRLGAATLTHNRGLQSERSAEAARQESAPVCLQAFPPACLSWKIKGGGVVFHPCSDLKPYQRRLYLPWWFCYWPEDQHSEWIKWIWGFLWQPIGRLKICVSRPGGLWRNSKHSYPKDKWQMFKTLGVLCGSKRLILQIKAREGPRLTVLEPKIACDKYPTVATYIFRTHRSSK